MERKVKRHTRRLKSGKVVTVREHTASYSGGRKSMEPGSGKAYERKKRAKEGTESLKSLREAWKANKGDSTFKRWMGAVERHLNEGKRISNLDRGYYGQYNYDRKRGFKSNGVKVGVRGSKK